MEEKDKKGILKKWFDAGLINNNEMNGEKIEFPKMTKAVMKSVDTSHIAIDEYRLVKSGTIIWSIKNQSNLALTQDTIVQIKQTCYGSTWVFVKPMQVIFQFLIPGIIGLGTDEWSLDYSKTEPYTLPTPQIF